eukprot:6999399-Alexandrium_andersonii.AAC.1
MSHGRSPLIPPRRVSMSPMRAQSPRLRATVNHAQDLPCEDEPPRAAHARPSERGRGEHHHPGL